MTLWAEFIEHVRYGRIEALGDIRSVLKHCGRSIADLVAALASEPDRNGMLPSTLPAAVENIANAQEKWDRLLKRLSDGEAVSGNDAFAILQSNGTGVAELVAAWKGSKHE